MRRRPSALRPALVNFFLSPAIVLNLIRQQLAFKLVSSLGAVIPDDLLRAISCQARPDPRDRRPLEYPLRVCSPMTQSAASAWLKCDLARNNRTTKRATMLTSKDMVLIEGLSDQQLPNTTSDGDVNPAEKYSQLGESAADALIDSTIGSVACPDRTAIVLIDLSPKSGFFCRAFLRRWVTLQQPCYYWAAGSSVEIDWCKSEFSDLGMQLFLSKQLKIADRQPLAETLADEQANIAAPQVHVIQLDGQNAEVANLHFRKWSKHAVFGDEFQTLCQELRTQLPHVEGGGGSAPKRQRVGSGNPVLMDLTNDSADEAAVAVPQLPLGSLSADQVLVAVPCSGAAKGLHIHAHPDGAVYLANTGASDVAVSSRTFLCGWAKGKWFSPVLSQEDDCHVNPDTDVPFAFQSMEDYVLMDKNMMTLQRVVEKQRETAPEKFNIRYHRLKDIPDATNPAKMAIELVHQVYWRAEWVNVQETATDGVKKTPQTQAASLVKVHCWNEQIAQIFWQVRWSKPGLCGIRPHVYLTAALILKAGHAVQLTK